MNETTTPETEDQSTELNPIITWASSRPHWEKYIWKLQLEQGSLLEEQLQEAYRLFKICNGILPQEELEEIDLSELTPPASIPETSQPLLAIKGIKNVNAMKDETEIKFGPKLTVCFGANGSGKSGYGRIIASACFTRGERKIYPNLRAESNATNPAKADFVVGLGENEQTISFTHGSPSNPVLQRFSMFDSHSAHIQLDNENILQFTPAQLAVFDKINILVKSMEIRLEEEKSLNLIGNPLENSFGDVTSNISKSLIDPDLTKEDAEILLYAEYPPEGDKIIKEFNKKKEELVKQNIDAEKKKLGEDRNIIERFKREMQTFKKNYSNEGRDNVNRLIKDVADNKKVVAKLGAETFNDGIFKSTGSEKWKSLLRAAKELYDQETELNGEVIELKECLLCHQALNEKEQTLFSNYWDFLRSTAATDLKTAQEFLDKERKRIEQVKLTCPRTHEDETIIKVLVGLGKTELVNDLRIHLAKADSTLSEWDHKIESLSEVDNAEIPEFLTTLFDSFIIGIDDKLSKLKDPKKDIEVIDIQVIELQHRKLASNVKDKYKEYLIWRRWLAKANAVSMSGTKRNYTDERSNLFDAIVTDQYIQVFQEECDALRADTDLQIKKRGSDGKTLVSKKLSFSNDKAPSEVLSEGEQKVCAIADFLSEARLDPRNWGIIFDDPVTSLDHERKGRIAERLVAQTDQRQVIVFTHDITFLLSLLTHAELKKVDCKRLTVRKVGENTGVADEKMPWVAENCKARKGILRKEFQQIEAMFNRNEHPNDIERSVKLWCELLRESWERAVEERVLQGVVERFRPSVQTTKLSKLSHLNDSTILPEIDAGMTESSKWVHDRSAWLNCPMTDASELETYMVRYENFLRKCPIK